MNDKIILLFNAFLYRGKTAVNSKDIIKNSVDSDYENIALHLSEDFIEEAYRTLLRMRAMTKFAKKEGLL
ncbi:hypothetical protein Calow_0814 [Caldicellulosiruptor owensensis OL]|uniref:Uncharacterized protein n=1 Tax=Caldicellulosiruptor owensensis (strain ATCC 700167 / DSM 13100 / OL) TaxID=632518 RepID=E4Q608_CALOW|nr:hypothetical protein [Caldicellulosiruptor owensensis]ADQ04382.1 hypothetical protein Calow_0814 [Caldicellulosiruptor owensensis OL]